MFWLLFDYYYLCNSVVKKILKIYIKYLCIWVIEKNNILNVNNWIGNGFC